MAGFGVLQRFKLQVAVDRRQRRRDGSSAPASEVRKVEVTPEVEHAALQALAACGPAVEASPPWSSYSDHWSRSTGVANLRIGKGKDDGRRHRPRPAPTTAHGRPRHDLPSFGFGQIAESIMPSYVCKTATRCQHTCPPTFGSQGSQATLSDESEARVTG